MNEIFELNSLLRGEDSERIELEKKKVSLVTAVQHQESRVRIKLCIPSCFVFRQLL